MIDLTNLEEIKKLDPQNIFGSTGMFIDQCKQIWEDAKKVNYPPDYKKVKNITLCGMGGSAYGGHIIQRLYKDSLCAPVTVVSDYTLPAYVNKDSLVFIASFSGNTEEPLFCANAALKKGAKITVLTTGGKATQFLKNNNLPGLIFEPKYNPSNQPRLGTGYMVLGVIALLNRAGLLNVSDSEIKEAIEELIQGMSDIQNQTRDLAQKIYESIPVIFAAEFLGGNAHIIRNQFNETAKSFSAFSELPELNHHLMEGLKNPPDKKLTVLLITSDLYSKDIQTRFELTYDVVTKNNVPVLQYQAQGKSKLSQMLHVLAFGGYLTLYTALLYGQNPSVIPWVDYFKEQMEKKRKS